MDGRINNPLNKQGDPNSPEDLQARIRQLTIAATRLFERGSYDTAFDSLMKAYILDPASPHVLACERTLLPALELMRKRGLLEEQQSDYPRPENLQRARSRVNKMESMAASPPAGTATPSPSSTSPAPPGTGQQQRLEELKKQIELARREKERAMWREASKPPKLIDTNTGTQEESERRSSTPEVPKPPRGFFLKLRQGKSPG